MARGKRTLGIISDEILAIRAEEKILKEGLDGLEKDRRALEAELQVAAEKEGVTAGGSKKSKFVIAEQTAPQVSNWDEFYDYIGENKYWHLLHRRAASLACQELWERGTVIPGVEKYVSVKVTVKGV